MKPRLIFASVVLTLAVGLVAAAQNRPNFAGTWRPVDAKGTGDDLIITQDATTLTLSHPHGDGHHRTTHDLSGKPHKSPNPGHPADHDTSIAKWEDSTLVVEIALSNGVKMKQRFSLGKDGLLTIEDTTTFPDGRKDEANKMVLRKQ